MGVRVVFPDMGKDPSVQLIEKTITQNGTYDAITDGANGYSKVNVNVEGGGGSSDFSTAQVTMQNTTENYEETPFAYLEGDVLHMESIPIPTEKMTFTIPLYKGHAQIPYSKQYTLGGNAEAKGSGLGRYIDITGDCTITIS